MKRREFITLLGGAAATWPMAARAQNSTRMQRLGVIMNLPENDPEGLVRDAAFRQRLQEFGWIVGRNLQIDYRWGTGDPALFRRYAAELLALAPDVILTSGVAVRALQAATDTVPIVFTATIDPVALGYVRTLAKPGGNITGFINIEYGFSAKWLELLKEIDPRVKRAAVLVDLDPAISVGIAQFTAIQAAAAHSGVELIQINVRDTGKIEHAITTFAREANGGLITTASTATTSHRHLITALAARHGLPAVYPNRMYVSIGGLISYGPLFVDQYRQAADYVNRILMGAKPNDLPVQAPTRYELVLNLKTAKALGLSVPRILLVRADELVE
jgi:putative ABC transport system substrate-binding protein